MVAVARSGEVADAAEELRGWVVVGVVPGTAEAVVAAAKDSIAAASGEPTAPFHARPSGPVGPGDNADAASH